MLKIIATLVIILLIIGAYISFPSYAGGDKVHGEKAIGTPSQNCINFGECPYENPID